MWWTRIFSSVAGGRLPLAILFVLLALLGVSYGVGRSHANTAWEARWHTRDVEDAEAAAAAGERYARVLQETVVKAAEAERMYADSESRNAALSGTVASLNERLRYYSRRASALSSAANCPAPVDAPAGPAFDAGRVSEALGDFIAEWGRIRDAEAGRLSAIQSLSTVK